MSHEVDLSPAQQAAVSHVDGPLLVVAGAGTGKTRVITHRIAHLISTGAASADRILALTFTNKAANEMKERVASLIGESFSELWISTFHAFAAEILRESALEAGISPVFQVLTPDQQLALLAQNLDSLELTYFKVKGRPLSLLWELMKTIARAKDEMIAADDLASFAALAESAETAKLTELARVYRRLDELQAANDALDFGDLILRVIGLFRSRPHILRHYQERWCYIMVDEFQDTNFSQSVLLDLLGSGHGNVCVVGDDDQSIYRFRGASVKNILEFQKRYPSVTSVKLEANYRSTPEIIAAAHSVISRNEARLEKTLHSVRKGRDESVTIVAAASPSDQAAYVAAVIAELLRTDESLRPEDVAVLFASARSEAAPFARALADRAVPAVILGGAGFFERPEIRDLLAWLRLLADPDDDESVIRALCAPPFSLRMADFHALSSAARGRFMARLKTAALPAASPPGLATVRRFLQAYERLLEQRERLPADVMLGEIIDMTQVRRALAVEATHEASRQLAAVSRLQALAGEFVAVSRDNHVRAFTEYLALLTAGRVGDGEEVEAGAPGVRLMTIHRAKGLEFRVVFVVNLTKSKMPGRRHTEAIPLPADLLKEELPAAEAREMHLSDRRRLLYVAMTRAREKLFLVYPKGEGPAGTKDEPSPFLEDIMSDRRLEPVVVAGDNRIRHEPGTRRRLAPTLQRLAAAITQAESAEAAAGAAADLARDFWRLAQTGEASESLPPVRPYLPLSNGGLYLTVSDIIAYRNCPLQFKYRVILKIPPKSDVERQFGIGIHQVLQHFHKNYARAEASLERLHELLEDSSRQWRAPATVIEQFLERARSGLTGYFESFMADRAEPVYFEREFNWRFDKHLVSGRIDRVDKLPGGRFELIDYKTGRTWKPKEVRDDLQLSIYYLGATEVWGLEPEQLSYYFVLDNTKVPVVPDAGQLDKARQAVASVAEDILRERFDPVKNYVRCPRCDYRLICPAMEGSHNTEPV